MPIIRIDYDNGQVQKSDIEKLSFEMQKIVSARTEIVEVFVYANSAEITLKADPIEIFIEMSSNIMEKRENLIKDIKDDLKKWKSDADFSTPINLTLIPMTWEMEIGI
jgi:hypothetical protein